MSEIPSNPIVLPQRSRTVSPASNTSKSTTVDDEVDILAVSGDEETPNGEESDVESVHDATLEAEEEEGDVVEVSDGEEGEQYENEEAEEEEEEEEAEVTVVHEDDGEDETIDAGDETGTALGDEEAVDPENLTPAAKKIIQMFQKPSTDPNVDNYDYEEDEALYTVENFVLPFDNMLTFESVINTLSLGEKRYIVDYIKTSYETMQAEARRFKGQMRAINARSGRLRMQIKREENAQKSGIDPDKVPRSSKGIGKKFTE
uniref:Glutamic acid-rich protein n=1 Tax=Panagrellus redivivus TaxID=6233 RepID=A0A7E4ZRD1_PANRE